MARRVRISWTHSGAEGIPAYRSDRPPTAPRKLRAQDINVVFQPIVNLRNGKVFAHEALVRCRWPEFANPVALFTQASADKSCGHVGRIIRQVAFAECVGHPVFVNVHPDELTSRWLVRPDDPMCYHDSEVFIEITESAAFTHYELCRSVLKEVCARTGAHLVVDDLGAAYSNLKRVVDLEPKVVKLDRALVTGVDKNKRQATLVTFLVKMLTELGASVVAEGIETADELRAIQDCGAHFGQGYLLAKPGPAMPSASWNPSWGKRGSKRSMRSLSPRKPKAKTRRPPPKPRRS